MKDRAMVEWVRRRPRLTVYLVSQVILLIWWAAFYPGIMSFDSLMYVADSRPGHAWSGAHSVLYNAIIQASLHVTGDLGAVTLLQTVAMSATLAYLVGRVHALGAPLRWAVGAGLAVPVLPQLAQFTVTLWKDVPFTITAILAVGVLSELFQRRSRGLYLALFGCLLGMGLFRNNGFLIVFVGAVVLAVVTLREPGAWRERVVVPLCGVGAAALSLVFILGIYPAIGVKTPPAWLTYTPSFSDIGIAYKDRPETFTKADLALMRKVLPLSTWKETADCHSVQPMATAIDGKTHGLDRIDDKVSSDLVSLWLRVLARTPSEVFQARICRGSVAWVAYPSAADSSYKYDRDVPADQFGIPQRMNMVGDPVLKKLRSRPLSHTLHKVGASLIDATATPQLEWLLWRGATWCYAIYATVLALFAWGTATRRRRTVFFLAAVPLGQQLAVLADIPAQDARYMMAPIFIGVLLLPLLAVALRDRRRRGAEEATTTQQAEAVNA